jgi:hypothetical protein
MATTTAKTPFLRRLIGAAVLDTGTYEEVEGDRSATFQALAVVVMSSLAAGVGASRVDDIRLGTLAYFTAVALIAWAAWALVVFEVGYRLMPQKQTRANPEELLRTIGFATAPGLLRAFGIFPQSAGPAFAITTIWMLACMVVAVRQALDYDSTMRALAVCLIGGLLAAGVALGLGTLFAPTVY